MFSKKKAAPKKRSWELDADDDQPSAEFLKIQVEIAERERLIQEHSAAAAAEAERAKQEQEQQKLEQQKKEAASGDPLRPCDSQAAYLAEAAVPDAGATIVVANFHPKTRIHEMKQHFLQFGDLIEIALVGKQAFVTFERTKDANDALLDGALAPLNGKRLAISAAPADHKRPSGGFHGPSRWHRDDAIKKKEGMMADREARHEFNKREASERRGREKEQLDREKERNARRAAEEAARREAAEARKLLDSGSREGGAGGGSGERDGTRRRSRSRSRDRGRRPSPPRRDRDSSNSERRDRSGSPRRRSRSRDRDRDRGREGHSGERSRDHR